MMDWIEAAFAALQQQVFETGVLPVMHALGLGGYAEQAFDATEFFLIGAIEISLLAIFLGALERWRPVEDQSFAPEKRLDMLYTMLNRLGFVPLLLFVALMPLIDGVDGWMRMNNIIPWKLEDALPWLNTQPLWSFLFYLVILDLLAYWVHRAQHQFEWWWALHSLHHSQRQMSLWSDNRNHLLDSLVVDGVKALSALLIGVAPMQFVAITVAGRAIESLSHANFRAHFGWLGERVLVSPRFHRVHHAIGLGHEGVDRGCNFAVLLPIWDVLFRTANFALIFPATGVRDQEAGRDYGTTFWQQQWLGIKRIFRQA
jgi:sterol desaturase/sphingolipid hydroxylase (fatty acid hydroxylase superfamily)